MAGRFILLCGFVVIFLVCSLCTVAATPADTGTASSGVHEPGAPLKSANKGESSGGSEESRCIDDNAEEWKWLPQSTFKISTTTTYVGPNIYVPFSVKHITVDLLGDLDDWRVDQNFVDGLWHVMKQYCEDSSFLGKVAKGMLLRDIILDLVLELHHVAGCSINFGDLRPTRTGADGQYDLIFEYKRQDEWMGEKAAWLARMLILHVLPNHLKAKLDEVDMNDRFDPQLELDDYLSLAAERRLDVTDQVLADEAKKRHMPYFTKDGYLYLGRGKYQCRLAETETCKTTSKAIGISQDKKYTVDMLRKLGLPAPNPKLVHSVAEAIEAFHEFKGHSVVVKPVNNHGGRGVSVDLRSETEVAQAFAIARPLDYYNRVLVENFVSGDEHRLLVINGSFVAAAKRIPGHVIGDGNNTVRELLVILNMDPRRGEGHKEVLTKIDADADAERMLGKQGYTWHTVPTRGEVVYLRSVSNLSSGGMPVDVTDVVHPDNREMAERAAVATGLDVAGVDYVSEDITQSYKDIGGAIIEINHRPGIRMHIAPSKGKPHDVAGPIFDMLFPPGALAHAPIAAVTGTNGKTTTTQMVGHILTSAGHTVGMATTVGVYSRGQLVKKGMATGPGGAIRVLDDPLIDAAVLEVTRWAILRAGMGFSKCQVAACTNIAADHLGQYGIDTLEQMAEVKRVVLDAATEAVVLNADDPHCLGMANHTTARHVLYVTMDRSNRVVHDHIAAGKKALVLEEVTDGEMLVLYDDGARTPLMLTQEIPATLEGKAMHNVANAMTAAGLAYSFGKSLDDIRRGLNTFDTTFSQNPGRMNFYRDHPFTVMLDLAHNAHGMSAITSVVDSFDAKGKRRLLLRVTDNRQDKDYSDYARAAAGHFDHFFCCSTSTNNRREREYDKAVQIIWSALIKEGVPEEAIEILHGQSEPVDAILSAALPGDFVCIISDRDIHRAWNKIVNFRPKLAA